jgi:hypothetical protein
LASRERRGGGGFAKEKGGVGFTREKGRRRLHEREAEVAASPERSRETLPDLLRWGGKSPGSPAARAGRVWSPNNKKKTMGAIWLVVFVGRDWTGILGCQRRP